MESPGKEGGHSVGGIDRECTRLVVAVSDTEFSVDIIAPCLVG